MSLSWCSMKINHILTCRNIDIAMECRPDEWNGIDFKVDGSKLACFLNQAPVLDWYVLRWGPKSKHHKDTCLEVIGLHFQISISTLRLIKKIIRRTYLTNFEINKHALLITITKSRDAIFSNRFLQMFHCRFANATRVSSCKSNQ